MNNKEIYLITIIICQTLIIATLILLIYTTNIAGNSINKSYNNIDSKYLFGWEKYIDPYGNNESTSGINNSKRPFPIQNKTGSKETCYTIKIGNVFLIMWGDEGGSENYLKNIDWFYSLLENNSDKNILICSHDTPSDLINEVNKKFETMKNSTNIVAWIRGHEHYYGYAGLETKFIGDWNRVYWMGKRVYRVPEWNISHVYIDGIDTSQGGDFSHSYLFTFSEGNKTIQVGDFNHTSNRWNDSTQAAPGNYTLQMKYPFSYYNITKNNKSEKNEMKIRIWFSSDHHVDSNSTEFLDAINDADTYFPPWNISCVLGDIVTIASQENYKLWQNIRNNSHHTGEDFYLIRGNHDR